MVVVGTGAAGGSGPPPGRRDGVGARARFRRDGRSGEPGAARPPRVRLRAAAGIAASAVPLLAGVACAANGGSSSDAAASSTTFIPVAPTAVSQDAWCTVADGLVTAKALTSAAAVYRGPGAACPGR